jgi:3-hydroxyisobutyrate dehydrogenase-like beta-hydroxyacid dehydrogenase
MAFRIGFIGVGMMGHGMAVNILKHGYPLTVLAHQNRKPIDDLVEKGAREAADIGALVESSDIVFFCVRGAEEVELLVYGDNGVMANCRPGLILIDCTTSNPILSKRIAQDLTAQKAAFVDAPVTRAPKDAEAGTLNSLVGAEKDVFEIVKPILASYSENIAHFGPPGAGHSAKLINNFISCGYTALIVEGLSLCYQSGVNAETLYRVMAAGGADSGVLRKMVPPLLDGDFTGHQFTLSNACKDVGYFRDFAEGFGFNSYLADSLLAIYRSAVEAGLGDKMMASLMELHGRPSVTQQKQE